MSQIIAPPLKIEFPEQLALSNAVDGTRGNIAASEKAVGELRDLVLGLLYPVGAPIPWGTEIPPSSDYFIMKGQAFDGVANPILASIYGSNLKDMRGMSVVGKKDSDAVLSYQADGVKGHAHSAWAVATDLGTKWTDAGGSHAHGMKSRIAYGSGGNRATDAESGGLEGQATEVAGHHNHAVVMGAHGHSVVVNSFGGTENTVKAIRYNFIVRKG